jgi:lipoprotein-releasing system ATP-binding protein
MALKVTDLHKQFGGEDHPLSVLAGLSFELANGESLAITGPSGSGKSTLLHIVGALDEPTAGRVEADGVNPHGLSEPDAARFRNSVTGFIFQEHHLLPQYSVLENVLMPCLAFGTAGADEVTRAHDLLRRVDLTDRLDHRPAELSGGECQRAAVARSLINAPRLLLCDEPTGNLDSANADRVAGLLFELQQQEGSSLIVVTHSMDLASRCDRRFDLRTGG